MFLSYFVWTQIKPDIVPALIFDTLMILKKKNSVQKSYLNHVYTCRLMHLLIFGTRDLFNISYSRELYLVSKFLHFEELVRVKTAVCFEMIVSET